MLHIRRRRIAARRQAPQQTKLKVLPRYSFGDIRTALARAASQACTLPSTDANLLICGESGTGKELFAQSIHAASLRKDKPFVAVNCAAIPEGLLESELFGYEEGAFTGARRQGKAGMFELAHTGTLFLDEIGDLPLTLQGRLLRVLQERELVRVGGTQVIPLDVRVLAPRIRISAGLWQRNGSGRTSCRLNVLSLRLPPLREA
ncbi:MAG: sigma 54-interacting transcriptional regulator [Bilophila wadsworthia]